MLDQTGCGQSGTNRIDWTIESFARDNTILSQQEYLQSVIPVAHSMGGEIAWEVALAAPQSVIGIKGVDHVKNVGMTITQEGKPFSA